MKQVTTSVFLFALFLCGLGEIINVHIVPHTHDDVGWLKTVDEYYYGSKKEIQDAGVQYILDSVMTELEKNPDRKFIYVEIAFFYRWWNEQTEDMKNKVRGFVKNGQLEFINGGWCMNDEATTHYNAIIDQMTLGLKFIENNFGPEARPTIGWQIDPFGHSNEQASLFSQFGFNGFFFGRIDYADKTLRLNQSTMEMIWRGSQSLKELSDIFAGVLYTGYGPPGGFCWDQFCGDDPVQDDPNLEDNNVRQKVEDFINVVQSQAKHYKTNNVILTMGSDFQYSNALLWFKNLDKLIKYVNQNGSVNAMYSTPSIYLDYVHKSNMTWTVKTDDFFPYADNPWAYWTGYFTSRPGLKGYVRKCNSHLQVCKQLEAIHNGVKDTNISSDTLKMAMGVAQHHDAVSGTEKQHVADDYAKRLHIGEVECRALVSASLNELIQKVDNPMNLTYCEYLNISACPTSESGNFNLVVYNPLGRAYQWYLRFPVNTPAITVTGPTGKPLPVQVVPVSDSTNAVRRHLSNASYEAVVSVMGQPVPPLGYSVYTVRTSSNRLFQRQLSKRLKQTLDEDIVISNEHYEVEFSGSNGHIKKISNLVSKVSADINQQFFWYNSSSGNNKNSSQCSGAYIFRPNNSDVLPVDFENNDADIVNVYKGDLFTEVHQEFSKWVQQVVRLYTRLPLIEIEYTVGPIPVTGGLGKEVISRFDTFLDTKSIFYTDANGREMQKRVRNHRDTWEYNNTEPVAGNYYPVNSRIFIRDEDTEKMQLTIMTDRSQGGTSLKDGSVELMIHRRMLCDDSRGAGEPLNETGQFGDGLIIRGKQYVTLDAFNTSTYLHRMFSEGLLLEPELVFAESSQTFNETQHQYNLIGSIMQQDLPPNVHLLTLELQEPNVYLMRLEHQFESSDPILSEDVTISLSETFFIGSTIKEVVELSLGANAPLSDIKRYSWKTPTTGSQARGAFKDHQPVVAPKFDVNLSPMEIRTFNVTLAASP